MERMKHITILLIILCLFSGVSWSQDQTYSEEEFKIVMIEIRNDMSHSAEDISNSNYKDEWYEEYSKYEPAIQAVKFSDLTVHHKITKNINVNETIIVSTNGAHVWGNWIYTKPHIYIIEKINSKWEITVKKLLDDFGHSLYTECKPRDEYRYCYDHSFKFFIPKTYDLKSQYVFQQFHMGASGGHWEFYDISWNRYLDEYSIGSFTTGFPIVSPPDSDLYKSFK